jgi:hypothetical protein
MEQEIQNRIATTANGIDALDWSTVRAASVVCVGQVARALTAGTFGIS